MASLAHVVAGMAGGRVLARRSQATAMIVLAGLALLADVDVLAFSFGIPYSAPFGHRGATHSLAFAALFAAPAAYALARGGVCSLRRALIVALAVALSHPVLDAMTDGGLGVALLWPLSTTRFFAPWRPLPVAPIGARMLSARGLHVLLVEAAWSLPFLVWTFWPRRSARFGAPDPSRESTAG